MHLQAFTITLQLPDWIGEDEAESAVTAAVACAVVELCQAATDADKREAGYKVEREVEVQH